MRKLFLGLFVAGIALSASAFTNVSNTTVAGERWVQDPANPGTYVLLTATYDPIEFCDDTIIETPCSFLQTNGSYGTDPLDISVLSGNPDFTPSAQDGVYTDL